MLVAQRLTTSAAVQDGSRREQAKGERRARIVNATYALLREIGIEELSMKAVAAKAGVSLSTCYNLFESKQAILARVFDQDLEHFEALVAAAPASDQLERIFNALDVAADLYQADSAFYRATMGRRSASGALSGEEDVMRGPRILFWQTMVAGAVRDGWVRSGTDPAVVGALMIQISGGVLADWIAGEISVDILRKEMKFGFAAALLPFATRPAAIKIRALIGLLHQELSTARKLRALVAVKLAG